MSPLMFAAEKGSCSVVKILLKYGANVSIKENGGFTALHLSAQHGHPALTTAHRGQWKAMEALIEAGANVNSHVLDGATPLLIASTQGYKDASKVLLRAKVDPQLQQNTSGNLFVPLNMLATRGDSDAVRELFRHVDIDGCGGPSRGVNALVTAARDKHVDIMVLLLTDAGVVDTGGALITAAHYGGVVSVEHLLQRQKQTAAERKAYVNAPGLFGATPLLWSIQACRPCSSRIARLLVDAGADTTSTVTMADVQGFGLMAYTPKEIAIRRIRRKKVEGKEDIVATSSCAAWRPSAACCCKWKQFVRSLGCGLATIPPSLTLLQRAQAEPPELGLR
ncbi:EsV-1-199 [Ectocarpus siliculosus]|uniref:EsV-1-199 n=1 Tax=Ectocarpus siliculosus TaxID=2880 RepID=D8LB36_ECTSI|nr:EsV-1-199 [Ectocarpus siliculosus]|eukprot:CBN76545.1 EsV-1-199 [Ectocarpus siliculosus]